MGQSGCAARREALYTKGVEIVLATIQHEIRRLVRDEEGASLVEYVLLVALIAVVCIAAVTLLGKSASDKFNTVGQAIKK
jgi:pilus assembly protein Flp/PilA